MGTCCTKHDRPLPPNPEHEAPLREPRRPKAVTRPPSDRPSRTSSSSAAPPPPARPPRRPDPTAHRTNQTQRQAAKSKWVATPSPPIVVPVAKWIQEGREQTTAKLDGKVVDVSVEFDGSHFDVTIDGYRVLQQKHFEQMRDMLLDTEVSPHADWKLAFETSGVKAWMRPPPPKQWLTNFKSKTELNQVKVYTELDYPPELVYDLIQDSGYRGKWDKHMIDGHCVAQLNARNDISYYAAHFPTPLSNRDFCLVRGWMELGNNEYAVLNYSVDHPKQPESKKYVRGLSYGCGYYLVPKGSGRCGLWLLSHTDMRMVIPSWLINRGLAPFIAGGIDAMRHGLKDYGAWRAQHKPRRVWATPPLPWGYLPEAIQSLVSEETRKRKAMALEEEVEAERMMSVLPAKGVVHAPLSTGVSWSEEGDDCVASFHTDYSASTFATEASSRYLVINVESPHSSATTTNTSASTVPPSKQHCLPPRTRQPPPRYLTF
eukprot:Sspe_Gene.100915::Locus_75556_Transcript_1_1_Confidence_1.000_Length_1696::g.100915::m.100915